MVMHVAHTGPIRAFGNPVFSTNFIDSSNMDISTPFEQSSGFEKGESTSSIEIMREFLNEQGNAPFDSVHEYHDHSKVNKFLVPQRIYGNENSFGKNDINDFQSFATARNDHHMSYSRFNQGRVKDSDSYSVNVAASALTSLHDQFSLESLPSIPMEDIIEDVPSLSWRSSNRSDIRIALQENRSDTRLSDDHQKMLIASGNSDRSTGTISALRKVGLEKDGNFTSIGSTVSGFSEICGSKKSIGSFDPSFISKGSLGRSGGQDNSAMSLCSPQNSPRSPQSPLFINCSSIPTSSESDASIDRINYLANRMSNQSLEDPANFTEPSSYASTPSHAQVAAKNYYAMKNQKTFQTIKPKFGPNQFNTYNETRCSDYQASNENVQNMYMMNKFGVHNRLAKSNDDCPTVTIRGVKEYQLPEKNPRFNGCGTTSTESWLDSESSSSEMKKATYGFRKISSGTSDDVSNDYERITNVATKSTRDTHFEIDETLWVTVPRHALCKASQCSYRNNATNVSHKKHYHARCNHTHQSGEKRGMPFHHHQLEKIKKHQRAHQMQASRGSGSNNASPSRINHALMGGSAASSPYSITEVTRILDCDKPWEPNEVERLRALAEAPGGGGWGDIAIALGTSRSEESCKAKWLEMCSMKNQEVKTGVGSWTQEEDEKLKTLVGVFGQKWAQICNHMPGRVGKQCRERYLNHLDPTLKKTPWTEEEDRLLIELHYKLKNSWADIARRIEGRCDNDVKNRWNLIQRRTNSRQNASPVKSKKPFVAVAASTFAGLMRPSYKSTSVSTSNGPVSNMRR